MFRKCLFLVTVVLMAATIVFAQGTFKPRNADEAHAWRLYNQYKQSKQQATKLEKGIKQTSDDIRSVSHGSLGALGASPEDVTALAKMRRQLAAENARQKNLENAWDKKFSGRYGDLKDSASPIYDPKTKKMMDKIQFRLIAFPFNVKGVNDGASTVPPANATTKGVEGEWVITYGGYVGDADANKERPSDQVLVISGAGANLQGKLFFSEIELEPLTNVTFDGTILRFTLPAEIMNVDLQQNFQAQIVGNRLQGTVSIKGGAPWKWWGTKKAPVR